MTEETDPNACPLCGGPLTQTGGLSLAQFRKLSGVCIPGECARERTIARDADGNFAHDSVAPASTIALVGSPRRSRFAR